MILLTAAFVSGVVLLQYQPTLPSPLYSVLLLPLAWMLWYLRRCLLIQLPLILLCGFLWSSMLAHYTITDRLKSGLEGVDLLMTGVIESLPETSPERTRFEFRVEQLSRSGEPVPAPRRVLLSWYQHPPDLAVGEQWQLMVRLKRPHSLSNPGGWDYERALYLGGIQATGYIRADKKNRRLGLIKWGYLFDQIREKIASEIAVVLGSEPVAGVVMALVIGDQSLISQAEWTLFRKTGTSHLMAISGLHIGMVSGLFMIIGRWLWQQSDGLCQLLPAPQVGALAALLAGFCYAGLAGFAIPCVRALLMLSVVLGTVLCRRTVLPSRSLCWALMIVVLVNPVAVISPGFWLSFGAVVAIFIGTVGRGSLKQSVVRGLFKVQWVVGLGLAPMLLLLGFDLPIISPLVNLLAVPLFALLLVPMLLLSVALLFLWAPLGSTLLTLVVWVLMQVQQLLSAVAAYSFSVTLNSDPPVWMLIGMLFAVVLMLFPAGIPGRWPGLLLMTPLLCLRATQPTLGELQMTMLDVGQGLAVVLETAGHVLLYDVGPRFPSGFDMGEAVVIPFLHARGITHIDRIIVSNGDIDHRGGLASVVKAFSTGDLLSGEPNRIYAANPDYCEAGMRWQWDGVMFEILHPDRSIPWKGNNASCVLAVKGAGGQILLTGDIEAEAEAAIVARYREQLAAAVVTVPHHGSATSSGTDFITASGARYGLISSGYRNRYGFPRESVRLRWNYAQTVLFNTAEVGAISLYMKRDGRIEGPEGYRQAVHRFWMLP